MLFRSEELTAIRSRLLDRESDFQSILQSARAGHERARVELEALLVDPSKHRTTVVTNHDLGLPGCTRYQARPARGLFAILGKWWRVKLSSGCP